ncbi:MAG TPA: hypothetical protein VK139_06380 [Microbacteriaceae bacterium]|nr:hypothetical protein [Microbacteriaceae bacterium]
MADASAVLATIHGKLALIAPPLEQRLGWRVTEAAVDTDAFGTFSGEIPRRHGPRDIAVAKARAGLDVVPAKFGLASEGTIGPHPAMPLVTADTELIAVVCPERD